MAERESVQLAWSGVVVINCTLVNGTPSTPTCYFIVPRNGYLSMHTATVMETFSPLLGDIPDPRLWFSFESVPIPWHIPMGVLLDRVAARKGLSDPMQLQPFPIVANFQNFPFDRILLFKNVSVAKAYYSHTVKAAMSVMYGSHMESYSRLSPRSYTQVTDAMEHNDADSFLASTAKLRSASGKPISRYPVVIHTETDRTTYLGVEAEEAASHTLGTFLRKYVSHLCGCYSDEQCSADMTSAGGMIVFIQGTLPLLSTPLIWLCENMCCADRFLHMVVYPLTNVAPTLTI